MANDETGLGNLVADAIRWYANRAAADSADPTPVAVAFESNGIIHDDIRKGTTGRIQVSDLFRVLPLGVGMDDTMAYPLIGVYLTAGEIKKALEIVTSIYPMKGSDYFLQCSGLRFAYNPNRMLFDRVTRIDLGSEEEGWTPLDYSASNTELYRITANLYNATFLKIVGNYTYHVLDIVPKDREGQPIADLVTARLDADRSTPGIQELKSWVGLMEYVGTFPDTDGNGIPDMPAKYLATLGRNLREPSWSPASLVSHASWVTWAAIGVAAVALLIVILLIVLIVRIVRRMPPPARRAKGLTRAYPAPASVLPSSKASCMSSALPAISPAPWARPYTIPTMGAPTWRNASWKVRRAFTAPETKGSGSAYVSTIPIRLPARPHPDGPTKAYSRSMKSLVWAEKVNQ